MTTTVFSVPEVSCRACQSAIETAVSPTAGVRSVAVDLDAKTVTIHYDEQVSREALRTSSRTRATTWPAPANRLREVNGSDHDTQADRTRRGR